MTATANHPICTRFHLAESQVCFLDGCHARSEGHARHARVEGHACHARGIWMGCQTLRGGRDKRVPPKGGPDKRVPPKGESEGHACHAR